MTRNTAIVDLSPANLDTLPCCGIKSAAHPGRLAKGCWLRAHFRKGLHAKVALGADGTECGYIEYLPGEFAWRGVEAAGYLFVHCIWVKKHPGTGIGGMLLDACRADAAAAGMRGVAAMVRGGPWLAGPAFYLKNGFQVVDSAPPDFQLLARKLDPSAPNPAFKGDWQKKLSRYGKGLTIIRSGQCPYIVKFAGEIADAARNEYGIEPRIVELRSHREAQNAPTPYAVFAVIHNGRLLADHQVSRTRFRNIMRAVSG